jgi:signal transduction protein with GAF and PtsI domain
MAKENYMQNKDFQYFKSFRDVCKVINSSLDLKEVLKLITENVGHALDVKGCSVFILDRQRNILEVSATHGVSEAYLKKGPLVADKSISETLQGKKVLISDISNDSRVQYPEEAKREGIASILSVPISVKEDIIGVLRIYTARQRDGVLRIYTARQRDFSDDECEFIAGLADMGGIAIDNARMYDHLKTDHEGLIHDVHRWFDYGNLP